MEAQMQTPTLIKRVIAVTLAALLSVGIAATPAAAKDITNTTFQIPIVGTTSTGGTFQGTAVITNFAANGGNVVAVGVITGVLDGTQSVVSTFTAPVTLPRTAAAAPAAAQAAAQCDILNLMLGPVNLNVLGLVISIPNPIVLNVTAVPGAGNLLGNLLCTVANLLNGGGAVQQIADLLNQILGILNGL
jgi:hypothetical protein